MDILMAFLAFSAVMIVLATMATVVVEVLHKLRRQRKNDFERMLKNYYLGSVKPLIKGAAEDEVDNFVESIRRNPAFAGEHLDEDKSSRNYLFDTAYESLTTPQFIEQLARSNVSENISAQVHAGEDKLIERLAAEFERYGEAAHDYFHRRAQVFALFAAVVLALSVNVDAIKLFQALSADNDLAKKVVAQIDPDVWEAKYKAAQNLGDDDTENLEQTIKKARARLRKDADVLTKLDLPMGHAFYPYCADSGLLQGEEENSEDKNEQAVDEMAKSTKIAEKGNFDTDNLNEIAKNLIQQAEVLDEKANGKHGDAQQLTDQANKLTEHAQLIAEQVKSLEKNVRSQNGDARQLTGQTDKLIEKAKQLKEQAKELAEINTTLLSKQGRHIDARCNEFFAEQLKSQGFSTWSALFLNNSKVFEFLKWLINALLAGLLIGLGAPFWFKTYRALADFIPGVDRGQTTESRGSTNDNKTSQTNRTSNAGNQNATATVPPNPSAVGTKALDNGRLTNLFNSAAKGNANE